MRAWHALPAQMRGMRFIVARVGAGPTRRVVARPQTGHDTAQACPSKHPDGFREALI
ncbi:MAG TPA: hypothetical protein VK753_06100 [Xanthomonadaceae bacterium]|nr:hypothetical protein [Xanthomonadaceae bacterium]